MKLQYRVSSEDLKYRSWVIWASFRLHFWS